MITLADIEAAERRIRPHLPATPMRSYAPLDQECGHGIRVLVKHENYNPTGSFKARNALSVLSALSPDERRRGVVAATRGNHGQGLAWAGALLGIPVTICVPEGNNPEKNLAMRGYGAELLEQGRDYDEAVTLAAELVRTRGLRLVHSTNDALVVAGAGTLALEMLRDGPTLDALVIAVGGGSQAAGAVIVSQALSQAFGQTLGAKLPVYAVQAERASAIHDSWHAGSPLSHASADTFADGLATRQTYELTFPILLAGLAGFVTISESELSDAVRRFIRTTHNLAEGAGAAGLAGLWKLRPVLQGARVGIVLSGANIDSATLRRVVTGEL